MKTQHIKSIALAIATAVAISSNSFAGTTKEMSRPQTQSTGYTKTILVGPKGYTSVVYTHKTTGDSSSLEAKDTPMKSPELDNGYQPVAI